MSHKTAVMNLPATYSTTNELIFEYLPQFVAWYEDTILGFYDTIEQAQGKCKLHALCVECAV